MSHLLYGDQTWIAYSKCGLMKVLYISVKHSLSISLNCRRIIPRILVASLGIGTLRIPHYPIDATCRPCGAKNVSKSASDYAYCGQTAGWIRIPLGMEVGLGPGDIVLDRDPAATAAKGGSTSALRTFRLMSIVAKELDGSRCHLVRG